MTHVKILLKELSMPFPLLQESLKIVIILKKEYEEPRKVYEILLRFIKIYEYL